MGMGLPPVPQVPRSLSDYLDGVRLHNEMFAWRAEMEQMGVLIDKPRQEAIRREVLQARLDEIERVKQENILRIEREKAENIAAVDRKYAILDQALNAGGIDGLYWLWVCACGGVALVIHLLRSLG